MGQGAPGTPGIPGPKGDKGDQGDKGETELNASSLNALTDKIIKNKAFYTSLLNNDKFVTQVTNNLSDTQLQQLSAAMVKPETNLLTNLSSKIVKDYYSELPAAQLTDNDLNTKIKPKTLWCANGDICTIPGTAKGLKIGDWRITQNADGDLQFSKENYTSGNILFSNRIGNTTGNTMNISTGNIFTQQVNVGANPWKIYSEANNSGAIVFQKGDGAKHFKIHTDSTSQVQIGNWRIRQQDNDLQFDREGKGERAYIPDNKNIGHIMGADWVYQIRKADQQRCLDVNGGVTEQDCNWNWKANGNRIRAFRFDVTSSPPTVSPPPAVEVGP